MRSNEQFVAKVTMVPRKRLATVPLMYGENHLWADHADGRQPEISTSPETLIIRYNLYPFLELKGQENFILYRYLWPS